NQNLFRVANERTTFAEAFGMADQVLHSGVRSITDLMVLPGLINLDFADVRTVMTEMGKAMMGTGEATGEDRALMAAQNAIQNPLLDEVSLKGAKAVLVNVTGGLDMTLLEVDEAANAITDQVDPEANVIFGAAFDPALEGSIRVSVVATGMDGASIAAIEPARPQRVNATARPLIVEPVQPIAAEPAFEPVRAAEPVYAAPREPERIEPEPVFEARQSDLGFDAPLIPTPPPVITPPTVHVAQAETPRTVIVDPLVAEEDELDAPLYADPHFEDSRQQRKGFLSLFGGRPQQQQPRYEGPPTMRAAGRTGAAAAAPQLLEEAQVDDGEDLEIPSFLRRLAN
ncbi:MAG TPA: cell division protein FtsZ, partial [Caulobacter sp.]|nr:cell division protein FtsZ [Caulobacter sp.]